MDSTVNKRSILIGGHKTSISLEDSFWTGLRQIARERATTVSEIVSMIDASRGGSNLSSTIRVFVLDHYRNNAASMALPGPEVPTTVAQDKTPRSVAEVNGCAFVAGQAAIARRT